MVGSVLGESNDIFLHLLVKYNYPPAMRTQRTCTTLTQNCQVVDKHLPRPSNVYLRSMIVPVLAVAWCANVRTVCEAALRHCHCLARLYIIGMYGSLARVTRA
jgi:hypothetical protein